MDDPRFNDDIAVALSQQNDSVEEDKEAFLGMLSLLIRCHEKENADVLAGVQTNESSGQSVEKVEKVNDK